MRFAGSVFIGGCRAAVLNDLKHLAFDDPADAIQVGAALAFDIIWVHWLAP